MKNISEKPLNISPDELTERFVRGDVARTTEGSGLGLSICQLIIEHIGGRIWIDPDYTGGSRFFFTHPLQQPQPAKGRKESEV